MHGQIFDIPRKSRVKNLLLADPVSLKIVHLILVLPLQATPQEQML